MRTVLPIANWQRVQDEFARAKAFGDAHKAPGEAGWTDAYLLPSPSVPLASLNIHVDELAAGIERYLEPFDHVTTCYTTYCDEPITARAWGIEADAFELVVFADHPPTGRVENIWLEAWNSPTEVVEAAVEALGTIPQAEGLFLADWGWNCAFRLSEREQARDYLRQRRAASPDTGSEASV